MKRVQYTGTNANFTDTVVRRAWVLGEHYITDDFTADALIATGSFSDTTVPSGFTLGSALSASRNAEVSDEGKILPVTATATLTIPSNLMIDSIDLPIAADSTTLTITGAAGVSINGAAAGSFTASTRNTIVRLRRIATNSFVVAS